jgi:hypothetical protein
MTKCGGINLCNKFIKDHENYEIMITSGRNLMNELKNFTNKQQKIEYLEYNMKIYDELNYFHKINPNNETIGNILACINKLF